MCFLPSDFDGYFDGYRNKIDLFRLMRQTKNSLFSKKDLKYSFIRDRIKKRIV